MQKKTRRYSFAHVTNLSGSIDMEMPMPQARQLERDGKLKYDGQVTQTEAVEHLFTPLRGCTAKLLAKAGAS